MPEKSLCNRCSNSLCNCRKCRGLVKKSRDCDFYCVFSETEKECPGNLEHILGERELFEL